MDKPDIVEWAENRFGIKFFEWQKIVLREVANGKHIVMYPPPRIGKQCTLAITEAYGKTFKKENKQ